LESGSVQPLFTPAFLPDLFATRIADYGSLSVGTIVLAIQTENTIDVGIDSYWPHSMNCERRIQTILGKKMKGPLTVLFASVQNGAPIRLAYRLRLSQIGYNPAR
jgi:hypothetical protein